MLLSLLWAVEASAARVSLLSFEGDRARSIRWRVAQALKRGGHTVLGFAPPSVRGSAAALRDYADHRSVDLFVSGSSVEGPQGLQLELRFRGADGKPVAQPVRLTAENLRGLVQELKGDGLAQIDGAVRGSGGASRRAASGGGSELEVGRALPLPRRRARAARKVDDRPVLPGAAPVEEEPGPAQKRRPREVDLDAAVAGPGGGEAWDADGSEPSESRRERRAKTRSAGSAGVLAAARLASAEGRGTKKRSATQQPAATDDPGPIDLDDDTRGALEESPGDVAAAAADPLAQPTADGAGSAEDPEPISIDDELPAEEPAAKPKRKKGGLFAGKLGRKKASEESLDSSGGATPEDSDPDSSDSAAAGSLPNARLSARAGFMRRSLRYSDDLYNRLRTPTTNGWVYRLDAALYPFARPLKDRLSLIGSYEGAVASTVRDDRSNRDIAVNFSELEGGLRYRQPLGKHELGAQLTAGTMSAGLDGSAVTSGVPEIAYTLLTPTADAGLHFGPLTMRASVSYQYLLGGLGELASAEWFPRAEGSGFKGQVGLEYRLSSSVSLQASGAVRRFVLEMNARPEDARRGQAEVAGGAVDSYTSGYLGLAFTL